MKNKKGILTHVILMLYVIITLYPVFWAFQNSFKTSAEVISHPFAIPTDFQFVNYINAWTSSKISTYFFNSLYISTLASVVSMVLAAMTAYAVTRMRFKTMSKIVQAFIGLALMIPGSFLLVPLFFLLNDMKIVNTHAALIIPYITFGIPLTVFVISAFLRSIPNDLEEAGVMDGLSAYGLFWRVILPLCTPALVTVFILNFLGNWNEFVMAQFFLTKETLRTLPVGMVAFMNSLNMNYSGLFASTMFSVIPVVVIYAILQEKIIEGVTAGSVKG
ncbi:carbohydrate ABC transporter permease [Paenibacillus sp. N1-5-1-14]|uniref:carbohydrate ABC transporter permease n=1 Tax=Paenibacillus radicibacter TaxID=2972488 RepID=UPI00215999B9|nr:carbohydrate ABC transporter permease [Paenibacillus radicibacter]MCR8644063.1 carbohydrate ABC transporter permease [Paenibacillus radicibacter]